MAGLTAKEKKTLARLQAKQKRADQEQKKFFARAARDAEEVANYLLKKKPEAVASAIQKYGYILVKNGTEPSGQNATDSGESADQNSHESGQASVDDFGFDNDGDFYDEPPHF